MHPPPSANWSLMPPWMSSDNKAQDPELTLRHFSPTALPCPVAVRGRGQYRDLPAPSLWHLCVPRLGQCSGLDHRRLLHVHGAHLCRLQALQPAWLLAGGTCGAPNLPSSGPPQGPMCMCGVCCQVPCSSGQGAQRTEAGCVPVLRCKHLRVYLLTCRITGVVCVPR